MRRWGVPATCVFLSSSPGVRAEQADAIRALARAIVARGHDLVYGGAHRGLMGVLADAALAAGGRVHGVIPRALVELEVAHTGLTELHVVDGMHARKAAMFHRADGFIVAPGGFGTLEEAFEILTAAQLGMHAKPLVFYDVGGFWHQFEPFLDHAVAEGVLAAVNRDLVRIVDDPERAVDLVTPGLGLTAAR
jgi:uncharacterized protein (TIGR00730 family)